MDDVQRINHLPLFVANLDVDHGGTYMQPHCGQFAQVATAWLQWQLRDDRKPPKPSPATLPASPNNKAGDSKRKKSPDAVPPIASILSSAIRK